MKTTLKTTDSDSAAFAESAETAESDPKKSVSTGGFLKEGSPSAEAAPVETAAESGAEPMPLDALLRELQAARLALAEIRDRAEDLRVQVLDALDHAPGRYKVAGFGALTIQTRTRRQFDAGRFRAAHRDLWLRYSHTAPYALLKLEPRDGRAS